jgi:Arm DNA-binding domain/Phage integrase SAM-like domain
MKVNEHLSILFLLERSKTTADGLAPIYVRITVEGSRTPLSTGAKVHPDCWDQESEQVTITAKNRDQAIINTIITQSRAKITTHYFVLESQHQYVTAEMVKLAYQGKPDQEQLEKQKIAEKTLCQVYNYKHSIFAAQIKKGLRAPASLTKWKSTKKKLRHFLQSKFKKWDIALSKIKYPLAQDFLNYLTLHDNLDENTANKYVKNVKELLKIACSPNWLTVNPWDGFEAGYTPSERECLSMLDILNLYNKDGLCKRLEEVRDIFLFACFTGYAFKEFKHLTPDDIYIGDDGKQWIKIDRKKTGNPESLPLLPIPASIVEKYAADKYCKKAGVLLPVNSNQKYNAYLKELEIFAESESPLQRI